MPDHPIGHRQISETMGQLMGEIQTEMESEVIAMVILSPMGKLGLTYPESVDRAVVIRALRQILSNEP